MHLGHELSGTECEPVHRAPDPPETAASASLEWPLPERQDGSSISDLGINEKRGSERRLRTLYALWKGNSLRRRRDGDAHPAGVDWHDAHWLAVAIGVVLLSFVDALFTLSLLRHGAEEANPAMAPLVLGTGRSFAIWKLGLTITGVVTLVVLARARLFGVLSAGLLLYLVLAGYVVLVIYEWRLLLRIGSLVSYWSAVPLHYPT